MAKIDFLDNGNIKIRIPISFKMIGSHKKIIVAEEEKTEVDFSDISALAFSLARAFRWRKFIDDGLFPDSGALADALKIDRASVNRTLRLTFLSPKIVHAILTNNIPPELTISKLRIQIPTLWSEQDKFFGFQNGE